MTHLDYRGMAREKSITAVCAQMKTSVSGCSVVFTGNRIIMQLVFNAMI